MHSFLAPSDPKFAHSIPRRPRKSIGSPTLFLLRESRARDSAPTHRAQHGAPGHRSPRRRRASMTQTPLTKKSTKRKTWTAAEVEERLRTGQPLDNDDLVVELGYCLTVGVYLAMLKGGKREP